MITIVDEALGSPLHWHCFGDVSLSLLLMFDQHIYHATTVTSVIAAVATNTSNPSTLRLTIAALETSLNLRAYPFNLFDVFVFGSCSWNENSLRLSHIYIYIYIYIYQGILQHPGWWESRIHSRKAALFPCRLCPNTAYQKIACLADKNRSCFA